MLSQALPVGSSAIWPGNKGYHTKLSNTFREIELRKCSYCLKVKRLKIASWGFFNTAAVRPIVFLPPAGSRIHLQRRHASYRCARPLPTKAGTITNEFC